MNTSMRWLLNLFILGSWLLTACAGDAVKPPTLAPSIAPLPTSTTHAVATLAPATDTPPTLGGKPRSAFTVALKPLSLAPRNQVMTVAFTVTSSMDRPHTQVIFDLPPEIILVSGVITQTYDFVANIPHTFTIDIQPTAIGEYTILAWVLYTAEDKSWAEGATGAFFLEVGEQQTTVLFEKILPMCTWPMQAIEEGVPTPVVSPTPCR